MAIIFTAPVNFTYSVLIELIPNYLQQTPGTNPSSGFYNQIPTFIGLAEKTLAASIKNIGQLFNLNLTNISEVIAKPEGWRQTKSMQAIDTITNESNFVLERTYEFCREFSTECTDTYLSTIGQLPQYYSDYDNDYFFLSPFNSDTAANITLRLAYFAAPQQLSETNQTNYWTTFAPECLFYASIMHALIYLRMPERQAEMNAILQQAISAINSENNNRVNDQSYKIKPALQDSGIG